jgi:hypothetical protein
MNTEEVTDLLASYWPAEANVAGTQYVGVIAAEVSKGSDGVDDMFVKTEGEHAYGILEAVNTLIASATLLVTCLQLRQSIKDSRDARSEIEKRLNEALPAERAKAAANEIVPKD